MKPLSLTAAVAALTLAAGSPVLAQNLSATGLPAPALPRAVPAIPQPTAPAYPGVIRLEVDATDLDRQIMRVAQTVPVAPGPLVLLYPRFLLGNHAPTGPISQMAGLEITANGERLDWIRDTVDPWAFHLDIPDGVREISVSFQHLTPQGDNQGRVLMTPEMLNLQWEKALLYPAGYVATGVRVAPSVRLPDGWRYGVALDTASFEGGVATFAETDLYTLIDSPMFSGLHYQRFDLDPGAARPVHVTAVSDTPANLAEPEAKIESLRQLVVQADRLFGLRHFDHYEFLVGLTDQLGDIGLEHHRSSENTVAEGYFTGRGVVPYGDLAVLPHEYVHSWNGKFMRPADQLVANYNVPTQNSLLWVYEGQTQFWGDVLTARSGLVSKEAALSNLAVIAANLANQAGRDWRPLQDTTNSNLLGYRAPNGYPSWMRGTDYYRESSLIWYDADTLIRAETRGRKSLDDFARGFFGPGEGDWTPRPYTFDDVVAALNAVHPHDWAAFLRERLDTPGRPAPLDGIERGGYRLTWTDALTDEEKKVQTDWENDFQYSLGFTLTRTLAITGVRWGFPAFEAGVGSGWTLVAVDDVAANAERLRDALTAARASGAPIRLLMKRGDRYRTVEFTYRDGLRYPRLERIPGTLDRLGDILAPRRR